MDEAHGNVAGQPEMVLVFDLDREGVVYDYRALDPSSLYVPADQVLGRSVFDMLPGEALREVREALKEAATTGKPVSALYDLNMSGGRRLYAVTIGPRREPHAEGDLYTAMVLDLTEQEHICRERQEALGRARRFEQIVRRSPAVVFLWRVAEGWPVEFVSDNVSRFGYEPEDFISGRVSWVGVTHPDDVPRLESEVARHMEAGRDQFSQEYRIFAADGGVIWIEDYTRAVRDDSGSLTHFEGILLDVTERRKAQRKARSYQNRIRSMASEMALLEQRERRRLATALHDDIAQHLALSRIKLSAARKAHGGDQEEHLLSADELLGEAIRRTRDIMADILPPVLDRMGLVAALEELLERLQQHHDLDCHLRDDERPKPMSADVRDMLYRAAKELAHNTIKHAGARNLRIYLKRQGNEVEMRVTDDGRGFDPARARREGEHAGFGLFSVRERAMHLGGSFSLWSEADHGTVVTLRAPLAADGTTDR